MFFQDLKYSLRAVRKNPAVMLTAISVLALGIGANTALFTLFHAVLLRPLNYPNPGAIVAVTRHYIVDNVASVTPLKFAFWRAQNHSFQAIAAHDYLPSGINLGGVGEPERLSRLEITADYFKVLGVAPRFGRGFTESEDKPGAGSYAVLSYRLWKRLFQGDPGVIGKTIALSGANHVIVGVMPQGFESPMAVDLWTPLQLNIDPADHGNDYCVIARLRDGVSIEQARADMRVVAQHLREQYKNDPMVMGEHETAAVIDYHKWLVGDLKTPLLVLMGAVGLVLLLACANVANLLLARSAARQHELAVRAALGASSWNLIRQLLAESVVLSLIGGAVGVLLAQSALPVLLSLTPANSGSESALPGLLRLTPGGGSGQAISLDWPVLAFAAIVSLCTGLLFGTLPALYSRRISISSPLREAGTRTTAAAGANRARQVLVIAEVAISLVLLVGAGLLIETFAKLSGVAPGFDAHNVITMQMSLPGRQFNTTAATARLTREVAERLESLPGVIAAGSVSALPFETGGDLPFELAGHPVTLDNMPDEQFRMASPHYFSVMRMPIVAGRPFNERDDAHAPGVAIVNEAFVRKFLPKSPAVGQNILIGRVMGPVFADIPRQIVGVVGDTRDAGLNEAPPPIIFEPVAQVRENLTALMNQLSPWRWVIRTKWRDGALVEEIRRAASAASGGVPMADPRPLESIIGNSIARQRFSMMLLAIFAAVALLLANVGLYGVLSYSVTQRTREIGIRSALGADRAELLRLVIAHGMKLAGIGLAAGVAASVVLSRSLASMLYGVKPWDPLVICGVVGILACVAFVACWLPARRVARIDPMIALRHD